MRILYQVKSIGTEDNILLASIDVTDKTEQEKQSILQNLRDLYGLSCTYIEHRCNHIINLPCTIIIL